MVFCFCTCPLLFPLWRWSFSNWWVSFDIFKWACWCVGCESLPNGRRCSDHIIRMSLHVSLVAVGWKWMGLDWCLYLCNHRRTAGWWLWNWIFYGILCMLNTRMQMWMWMSVEYCINGSYIIFRRLGSTIVARCLRNRNAAGSQFFECFMDSIGNFIKYLIQCFWSKTKNSMQAYFIRNTDTSHVWKGQWNFHRESVPIRRSVH